MLEELGSDAHVFFTVDAPPMTAEVLEAASEEGLLPARPARSSPPASTPRTRAARARERSALAVDPARFHFFDPDTGAPARAGRRRAALVGAS